MPLLSGVNLFPFIVNFGISSKHCFHTMTEKKRTRWQVRFFCGGGLLGGAALLTVFAGGGAGLFFENPREIALVVEADGDRNFRN